MMTGLRGSANYIWDLKHPLGQGATSLVCPGRHKRTGEQFAVKVFNQAGNLRPTGVKNREFDVLRKLNHDNIVRMVASEEEQSATSQVIVMELCTGGSLYSILEEPTNAFGLGEEEFLSVLGHVASGMKHLRENGVIHRDIKPGNIMRYIADDGRSIYKLTDFGAARELEEEEQFMSLYGTEEYLHPDMYGRAVLRGQEYKVFDATVDLWSLGVTFYHVLTGQLPFRPFGGRRNRETMHKITTQKESGVISGVQPNEGGPIEWSRELPSSCRASHGLQLLVNPFLAGLLEADCRKTWQFDKFFIEAKKITTKKVVHMYCPSMWQLLRIYADPTDTLTKLQELVAQQTEFPASSQVLIYQSNLLSDVVDGSLPVSAYPKCMSPNTPIYVFTLENRDAPKFPNPHISNFPRFSTSMSLDNDYPLSKMCLGILHSIHREIQDAVLRQRLTHDAVVNYVNQLYHSLEHLKDYEFHLRNHCKETEKRKADLTRSTEEKVKLVKLFTSGNASLATALHQVSTAWHSDRQTLEETESKMKQCLMNISKHTEDYTQHHLVDKQLMNSWKFKLGCVESDRCASTIAIIVKTVTDIMERFRSDKQRKNLPYNDEQIHKFEKNNLYTLTVKAKTTLQDHCISNSKTLFANLAIWLREATALRRESHKTEKQMEELIQLQQEFTLKLDRLVEQDNMSDVISDVLASSPSHEERNVTLHQNPPGSVNQGRQPMATDSFSIHDQPDSLMDELIKGMDSLKDDTQKVIATVKENNLTLYRQRFKGRHVNGTKHRETNLHAQRMDMDMSQSLTNCEPSSSATRAAEKGDTGALQALMQSGTSWDKGDKSGCSALHHAAKAGQVSVVNLLLSSNSEVNRMNNYGVVPLHCGSRCGVVDVVFILLNYGAKTDSLDNHGQTPLHWAVTKGDTGIVRVLIEHSSSTVTHNSPDVNGNRPLHFAAQSGKPAILRLLLGSVSSINDANGAGKTALHLAAVNCHSRAVKMLLEAGANVNVKDNNWFTPLHCATKIGHAPIVELLLLQGSDVDAKTKDGRTPLLLALQSGHRQVFELLVNHGAVINVCDEKYRYPLHVGVLNSHTDLVIRVLELGAVVNAVDRDGWTALHCASKGSNLDLVKLLLINGASVSTRDKTQLTSLHIAASNGPVSIASALVEYGSDIQAKDRLGRTPLHYAVASGNIGTVKFLLDRGADAFVPDDTGETAVNMASLCQTQTLAHLLTGQMTSLSILS